MADAISLSCLRTHAIKLRFLSLSRISSDYICPPPPIEQAFLFIDIKYGFFIGISDSFLSDAPPFGLRLCLRTGADSLGQPSRIRGDDVRMIALSIADDFEPWSRHGRLVSSD